MFTKAANADDLVELHLAVPKRFLEHIPVFSLQNSADLDSRNAFAFTMQRGVG